MNIPIFSTKESSVGARMTSPTDTDLALRFPREFEHTRVKHDKPFKITIIILF